MQLEAVSLAAATLWPASAAPRLGCGCQCVCVLQGDRYHGQTEVFGPAVQQQLSQLRVFLVGAGALGCEFIKNFAMMGVSTSSGGLVRCAWLETSPFCTLSAVCSAAS